MTDAPTSSADSGLKAQINKDLKTALLSGDKDRATVLRGLKSVILYAEVAKGSRDAGLPDDEIQALLSKEAKKRQESADLYKQGGNLEKAEAELAEKVMIEAYLPAQLSETEVHALVDEVANELGGVSKETMGRIIAGVKSKSGGAADGALVARLVKERLG